MYVCAECGRRSDRPGACATDGVQVERASDSLLGETVGRYRLTRVLGAGGMGKVYLAVQTAIAARVAIKVLQSSDPDAVDRFFSEARAVNLIRHDNIVNIVDLATLPDGRPYIVMELVEGSTLRQLIRTGTAPLELVVRVMTEVLSAVAAAHAIGIVHRDLKPDNVMIGRTGRVKVLDFGVAKLRRGVHGDHLPRTATGIALGTPYYMAPEQVRGADVDPRTDIYAAGVVLFEAVTGRRPFEASTDFAVMEAHLERDPPLASTYRPDLPRAIEQVIVKALAKRPDDRFQSARAMGRALTEALAGLGADQRAVAAPPPVARRPAKGRIAPPTADTVRDAPETRVQPPAPAPAVRPRRRRRAAIVAGVIAIGAGAAAAIAVVASRTQDDDGPTPAPVATGSAIDAAAAPPVRRDTGLLHGRDDFSVEVSGNTDYDPKRFDPVAYVDTARKMLDVVSADARLELLEFAGVRPDGTVDLTADATRVRRYWFVVPDAAPCRYQVEIGAASVKLSVAETQDGCRVDEPAAPRCSAKEIWDRARAARAPALPAYVTWSRAGWELQIENKDRRVVFIRAYDDDC